MLLKIVAQILNSVSKKEPTAELKYMDFVVHGFA